VPEEATPVLSMMSPLLALVDVDKSNDPLVVDVPEPDTTETAPPARAFPARMDTVAPEGAEPAPAVITRFPPATPPLPLPM